MIFYSKFLKIQLKMDDILLPLKIEFILNCFFLNFKFKYLSILKISKKIKFFNLLKKIPSKIAREIS